MMSGKMRATVAAIAMMVVASGCAKEREPRSYVQPNILAKSDLTGMWYYAPTVVDIGFSSSVTFIGETSMNVSIIKWDIQENVLYARLAYDRIRGTESEHNPLDGVAFAGEPIGAWSIKHFDIIRDYNATTGEETNTIRESTERPWYEREFLRVDWSENLVSNWDLLWFERTVSMDPLSYQITDPNHPHAPLIERNAQGEASYIGITAKAIVQPEMREYGYGGYPELPDCFFYGSTTSCTSTEVTVRHAFARLDSDHEYKPRQYTQIEMDDYGYFLTQRMNYNRDYGVTIGGITWYANRFNLYKEWFRKATTGGEALLHAELERGYSCAGGAEPCRYTDDNTKVFIKARIAYQSAELPTGVGSDDAHCYCDTDPDKCEGAPDAKPCFYIADGSSVYIDDHEGTEKFVLRPRDRPLKPIVYYLNETFPANLLPTVRGVADQWARAFNQAVWLAAGCKYADFLAWEAGGTNVCRPEFSDPGFTMLVLCENPVVQAGDPPECGPVGRTVRLGDIRYSHIVWVDAAQQYSPLGYGPPLADPLTGEVISAIANVYGAPIDSYSVWTKDIVRMLTDQNFEWEEYLWGRLQTNFVRNNMSGSYAMAEPASRNRLGQIPTRHRRSWETRSYTPDDIKRLYRQMDKGFAHAVPPSAGAPSTAEGYMSTAQAKAWIQSRVSHITNSHVLGNGTNPQQGRINMLRNSYWEDLMMTPEWLLGQSAELVAAGYDPMNVTGADIIPGSALRSRISPLTRLNVKYLRALEKVKGEHMTKTIMYPPDLMIPFSEPSTIGIAAEVVCTRCCTDSDKDQDGNCSGVEACKNDINEQTSRWEQDANCSENVKWRLRELIYDGVLIHEMGHNFGLRHNFKGSYDAMNYFDPYWEIRKMDGTVGPRTSDPVTQQELIHKIKHYQYTSIMDYGSKFNSDFEGLARHDYASIMHTYAGHTQVFNEVHNHDLISWLQTNRTFSYPSPGIRLWIGRPPESVQYTRIHFDPSLPDTAENAVDTSESNRDWVPTTWVTEQELTASSEVFRTDLTVEGKAGSTISRLMVPYKNCSDEFRNGSLGCNYFDEGADLFEITENLIQAYENYYIFNNFGRDRYEWGWDETRYTSRILGRYFDLMQNHLQYYVLWFTIFHDINLYTPSEIEWFFTEENEGLGTFTVAVARTFETFARVLNMPLPGYYRELPRMDGTMHWFQDGDPEYHQAPPGFMLEDCEEGNGCFYVDFMDGKYWDDTWDFDFGYQWYLRKIRYGQFYDRPLAIQMLGEATNNFMGRDTQDDVRKYTINYARLYPEQIKLIFRAIANQDLSIMAPSYCGVDSKGVAIIEHRDITNLTAPRCALTGGTFQGYLDPGDTFTTQLKSTTWGLSMFPMNYYQDFLDYSRIYVRGNLEGIDFSQLEACTAPGATPPCLVTFTDPFSLKTYEAVRYLPYNMETDPTQPPAWASNSIGAEMLQQALDIQGQYEYWQDEYNLDPSESNYDNMYLYRENLRSYIINLDVTRATSYLFEHPDYTEAN